jgi:hypothetical protein
MSPFRPILLAAAATALALPASATQRIELKKDEPGAVGVETSGEYRIEPWIRSDFPVDAEGHTLGQPILVEQRLRLRLDLQIRGFRASTEWDLFSGPTDGDPWDVPGIADERGRWGYRAGTPAGTVPRRIAVGYERPGFSVEAGLMTSHWGLGLVANDGAHDVTFGHTEFGDRVVRLRVTGRPALEGAGATAKRPLFFTGAFDWVIADDIARWQDRQLALQGIASVAWVVPERSRGGLYFVYRHQRELEADRQTDALVLDLFAERTRPLGTTGWTVTSAFEGALISGSTNRSLTYNARDWLKVTSGGFAGILSIAAPEKKVQVHLRTGLASGDSNPDDDTSSDFTFDRDYDVGIVLFDDVMGASEAATHALLTDPERAGRPPDGVDAIVTEGAFRRAAYVQPVLQVTPLPWLEVKGGVLLATATAPVTQAFYTYRAGGESRNFLNEKPANRDLGVEFDWAVRLGGALPVKTGTGPEITFLAQGGHLIPGAALAGMPHVHQLMFSGRVRW